MVTKSPAATETSKKEEPRLEQLLPEHIAKVLGEPPTLPFESVDRYDALFTEMLLHFSPRETDTLDFILIREITDIQWELGRLRGMRGAVMEIHLPAAAAELMKNELQDEFDTEFYIEERMVPIVRRAARGSIEDQDFFNTLAKRATATHRMLQAVAFSKSMNVHSSIEESIARKERRRGQLVSFYIDRRNAAAAMAKLLGGMSRAATDIEAPEKSTK